MRCTSVFTLAIIANILAHQGTTAENATLAPSKVSQPVNLRTRQPRPRRQRPAYPTTASPSKTPVTITSKPTHRRRPGRPSRAPIADTKTPSSSTPNTSTPYSPTSPTDNPTKTQLPISQTTKPQLPRPGQPTSSPTKASTNPTLSPSTTTPGTNSLIPPTYKPSANPKPTSSGPSTCNICGPGLVIGNPGGKLTMMGNCSQYQYLGNQGGIPPRLCSGFPVLAAVPCNCTAAPE